MGGALPPMVPVHDCVLRVDHPEGQFGLTGNSPENQTTHDEKVIHLVTQGRPKGFPPLHGATAGGLPTQGAYTTTQHWGEGFRP